MITSTSFCQNRQLFEIRDLKLTLVKDYLFAKILVTKYLKLPLLNCS